MALNTEPRGAQFELDPGKAPRRREVVAVVKPPLHTISLLVRNKPGVLVRQRRILLNSGHLDQRPCLRHVLEIRQLPQQGVDPLSLIHI